MAMLHKLKEQERELAMDRLNVMPKQKEMIIKGLRAVSSMLKIQPDDPVSIYHLLSGHDIEVILFSMALTRDNEKKKAISRFLLELRNVKPILKGNDLKNLGIPPGPEYSKILNRILDEKLMKRLQTKEDEIEFVRKHLISAV
jgi:tRNA nucleotidyltransferase (CCA-adding enzyme)